MVARGEETSSVHRGGAPVETKLHRIAEKARKEPMFKFTSLYHLMNEELLLDVQVFVNFSNSGVGKKC